MKLPLLIVTIAAGPLLWGQSLSGDYEKALDDAESLFNRGDLDAVIAKLSRWTEKLPDAKEAYHGLGLAFYEKKDFAGAIRHLSAAIKLEPEGSAARKQTVEVLGMSYYFNNRPREALPLLAKAVEWRPNNADVRYALAMCYVYTSDRDNARRNFAELFGISPDSSQAFVLAADLAFQEKHDADAEALIQEALKLQPDLPEANYKLALAAIGKGDFARAVELLRKELAGNPSHPMAWYWLGNAYTQTGKLDEAVESLQRAIWLNLRFASSYVLLANVYFQKEKFSGAEKALQRALEMEPENYQAHFLLSRVYYKTNRLQNAKDQMTIAERLRAGPSAIRK